MYLKSAFVTPAQLSNYPFAVGQCKNENSFVAYEALQLGDVTAYWRNFAGADVNGHITAELGVAGALDVEAGPVDARALRSDADAQPLQRRIAELRHHVRRLGRQLRQRQKGAEDLGAQQDEKNHRRGANGGFHGVDRLREGVIEERVERRNVVIGMIRQSGIADLFDPGCPPEPLLVGFGLHGDAIAPPAVKLQGQGSVDEAASKLAGMTPEDFLGLGEKYLRDTRIFRSGKPHFIDKMPNNFRHLGLIHLMLPNAKIIDARREPMACCFSNFKQLFAQGQEFTYGIEEIARYYRTYVELMDHWDAVLPGRVLRVQHEDVIDDLEASVRRILDYCGLPFEPACLEFHKTQRSVRTPSSEQVRQPIFRDGLDQWKNFSPWLEPLRTALDPDLSAI